MIDSAVTVATIAGLIHYLSGSTDLESFLLQANYADLLVVLGIPLGLHVVFATYSQKTFGMFALDLQIISDDAEPASWGHTIRRPLGLLVAVATVGLSALLPFLNDRSRTVGDLLSGTRVVESLAIGERISYNAWRVFKSIWKPMAPATLAVAIGVLLWNKQEGPNSEVLLDAAVLSVLVTLVVGISVSALKIKTSRVRIGPNGVVRSGLLGWSNKIIGWDEIDFVKVRPRRVFSHFEVHKKNRRTFRIPIEDNSARLAASAIADHGIRFEP